MSRARERRRRTTGSGAKSRRRVAGRRPWRAAASGVLFATSFASLSPAQPVSDLLAEALRPLPEHAVPLFAVGDVDESGAMDERDRQLIDALAGLDRARWSELPAATCPAAADLDLDADVDSADSKLARELLVGGGITAPALFGQPSLPCRFERPVFASLLEAAPGEELTIWDLRSDRQPSLVVSVVRGSARVVFLGRSETRIEIAAGPPGDLLVLRLALGVDRSYLFTLEIRPGSPSARDLDLH